jgi:hypothetical protein
VLLGMGVLATTLGLVLALRSRPAPTPAARVPIHVEPGDGFVGSGACESCHRAQYDSWHRSYHRSMTQAVSADSVRAPWQGVLTWRGQAYTLFRRDEQLWVRLPDLERVAELAREGSSPEGAPDAKPVEPQVVERQVVMTTGSHHYQAYWVPGTRGNELRQFPFVYHIESQRFLPRHDVFLQPEADPVHIARWNSNCIQCHSVGGQPRHDPLRDRFDSRVAELGIACEACHGPGAAHVAIEQSAEGRRRGDRDRRIVNPSRLDPERASEICGQCHSYFVPRDAEAWWTSGFTRSYRPGEDLDDSRRVLEHGPDGDDDDPELSTTLDSLFYPDGTIRVGGREWNGLRSSACFSRGEGERKLSCLSCHQMHGGSREDQLDAAGESNGACQGCHAGYGSAHSHHPEGSSGSQCVDCHMPRTTYALLKSIRSHRITRPDVDDAPGARINACNLCHQDRSLQWTAARLGEWYPPRGALRGASTPTPAPDAPPPWSALATAALRGDAAARVIAVRELGSPTGRAVSGSEWQPQLLIEALDDPYSAVRYVAQRSLRDFPGFEDLLFDFIAPHAVRLEQQAVARARLEARVTRPSTDGHAPALPVDQRGLFRRDVIDRLVRERDLRPIRIAE